MVGLFLMSVVVIVYAIPMAVWGAYKATRTGRVEDDNDDPYNGDNWEVL